MKRKPLLVDQFLAEVAQPPHKRKGTVIPWKRVMYVAQKLREAKRFVLSDEVSQYIGEMIDTVPAAIAHGQQFALQPFKTMYVEFDPRPLFEAVNHRMSDPTGDTKVGWLLDDGRVWMIVDNANARDKVRENILPILPLSFRLFKPWTITEEQKFCELTKRTRVAIDNYMWGAAYNKLSEESQRSFRANHSMRFEYEDDVKDKLVLLNDEHYTRAFDEIFAGGGGELRNVIATLMFLNRTSQVRIESHQAAQPTLLMRKPSTLLSHSVVSLNLRPTPKFYETMLGVGSIWRREHDVRGHFCHNERARNAWCVTHDWQEYDVNQWRCMGCSGLRWWRKEHHRGHKEKGRVKTTYEVTA